jgi:hypothetical protein
MRTMLALAALLTLAPLLATACFACHTSRKDHDFVFSTFGK